MRRFIGYTSIIMGVLAFLSAAKDVYFDSLLDTEAKVIQAQIIDKRKRTSQKEKFFLRRTTYSFKIMYEVDGKTYDPTKGVMPHYYFTNDVGDTIDNHYSPKFPLAIRLPEGMEDEGIGVSGMFFGSFFFLFGGIFVLRVPKKHLPKRYF